MVTLGPRQQLRMLVGFTPPNENELNREGDLKCCGRILACFPSIAAPNGNNEPLNKLLPLLSEQRRRCPDDKTLMHALLTGILKLLHPQDDPRALLSLGFAALQQQQAQREQGVKEKERLQVMHLLLQDLGIMWPLSAEPVASGLEMTTAQKLGLCPPLEAVPSIGNKGSAEYEEDFTLSISLIGLCQQSRLLLLAPSEGCTEDEERQTHQLKVSRKWTSYTSLKTPLVIDFNTTHVSPRRYPCKLLKLRAVSTLSINWRITPCHDRVRRSKSGSANTKPVSYCARAQMGKEVPNFGPFSCPGGNFENSLDIR